MLIRWNDLGQLGLSPSWAELGTIRREMNRLFQAYEDGRAAPDRFRRTEFPRVGFFDENDSLVLLAELPGIAQKDLDITVEDSTLNIRGTRRVDIPEGYAVHRQERAEATFARSFSLPCRVDSEKARAELNGGILRLTLPKAPDVKPRQISVRAS